MNKEQQDLIWEIVRNWHNEDEVLGAGVFYIEKIGGEDFIVFDLFEKTDPYSRMWRLNGEELSFEEVIDKYIERKKETLK